jgi:hypothetical protein
VDGALVRASSLCPFSSDLQAAWRFAPLDQLIIHHRVAESKGFHGSFDSYHIYNLT